jgi:hypothetical protein
MQAPRQRQRELPVLPVSGLRGLSGRPRVWSADSRSQEARPDPRWRTMRAGEWMLVLFLFR